MTSKQCPQCGQELQPLTPACPECRYNFFARQYTARTEGMADPLAPPSTSNKWKMATLGLGAIFAVFLGFLFIAMPVLTLWNMASAAKAKDGKTFATYIDFPTLRENLKADLNAEMMANMAKDTQSKDNPFAGLAAVVGPTIINNMVDGFVTPAGVERMMEGNFTPKPTGNVQPNPGFLPDTSDYEFSYTGINEFEVLIKHPNSRVILTLQRNSLVFWKLARVRWKV